MQKILGEYSGLLWASVSHRRSGSCLFFCFLLIPTWMIPVLKRKNDSWLPLVEWRCRNLQGIPWRIIVQEGISRLLFFFHMFFMTIKSSDNVVEVHKTAVTHSKLPETKSKFPVKTNELTLFHFRWRLCFLNKIILLRYLQASWKSEIKPKNVSFAF